MRKFCILTLAVFLYSFGSAQISTNDFQVKLGYNLSNPHAKRVNYLVNRFNANNSQNLVAPMASLSFPHGIVAGVNYEFGEYLVFYGNYKNRHQTLMAQYNDSGYFRKYHFRSNTFEFGAKYFFEETGRMKHYASLGINVGNMSVFTDWTPLEKNSGTKDMFNIDHSAVVGVTASYEVVYKVDDYIGVFIRPHYHIAAGSHIRNLNDFMNPVIEEDGDISYNSTEDDKYNVIGINGFGVEAGFILILPEMNSSK